ncbi:MAG: Hsp20/alpha crystallin family protein [Myxococcota bacterium]
MMTRWGDFQGTLAVMDEFRRRMDRVFEDWETGRQDGYSMTDGWAHAWPRTYLADAGASVVVRAEVPGLTEKDVNVTINQDVLTISGARKPEELRGYSVHRQERPATNFVRSFSLPCKVDAERTAAVVKNGMLTVTLPKAPESQPRQITVKAH